jgi:CoA-transferase family III
VSGSILIYLKPRSEPYVLRQLLLNVPKIAGLANIASNYLISGHEAGRHGTAHPSIVPYQVFPCKNGFLMIGAGNDKQVLPLSSR